MNDFQNDSTIPLIEDLGIIHWELLDGCQLITTHRYRVILPDLDQFLFEGSIEQVYPSFQLWLSSMKEQHPEYFQEESAVAFRQSHGRILEGWQKHNDEILQVDNSDTP